MQPPAICGDDDQLVGSIEAIARASHIRIRRVALTRDWWMRDGGPFLAYTRDDHHSVALLTISAWRYELFDPVCLTRQPVTALL